jgi:hypothetical protein
LNSGETFREGAERHDAGRARDDRSLVRLRVRPGATYVSSGRTVLATDEDGAVLPRLDRGLFIDETRLVSRYRHLVDGVPPRLVSASNVAQRSWLGYFIAPAPGGEAEKERDHISDGAQEALELRLSRYAGNGLHEDIDLTNFARWPVRVRLAIEVESDFADQAESGGDRLQTGRQTSTWTAGRKEWTLTTRYQAEHRYRHQGRAGLATIRRGVTLRFFSATSPPRRNGRRISFVVALAPQQSWHCCIDIVPHIEDRKLRPAYGCQSFIAPDNELERRTQIFLQEATQFSSPGSDTLTSVAVGALEQGKRDLASLRLFDLDVGDHAWTVAAGLPLYVALLGRDTLTAAGEAAPGARSHMRGT